MQPIPDDILAKLNELIANSYWRDSTTYPDHMQHSYCLRKNFPETYVALKSAIDEYGYDAPFFTKMYRYLIIDGHKYWAYDTLVNREELQLSENRSGKKELG